MKSSLKRSVFEISGYDREKYCFCQKKNIISFTETFFFDADLLWGRCLDTKEKILRHISFSLAHQSGLSLRHNVIFLTKLVHKLLPNSQLWEFLWYVHIYLFNPLFCHVHPLSLSRLSLILLFQWQGFVYNIFCNADIKSVCAQFVYSSCKPFLISLHRTDNKSLLKSVFILTTRRTCIYMVILLFS